MKYLFQTGGKMRHHITLIRPNGNSRFQIVPPVGLGYVAKAAKNAGWCCNIYDAWIYNHDPEKAAEVITNEAEIFGAPELIGVQVYYDTVQWTKRFIERVKYTAIMDETKIIIGGPQPSAYGYKVAHLVGADMAWKGQGELFFVTDIPDIPEWELMCLPMYWKHMQSATVPIRGKRPAVIQTSRGCPHLCTFCAGHVVHGRAVQLRTVESVLTEIRYLQRTYFIDEIWFQDDNFLYDPDRAKVILTQLYNSGLYLRFPNGIRIENADENMVKIMKRANVYQVGIGIESGSQRVLREVKKGLRLDWVRNAVELFHRYGIMTSGFFIVGLPPEREEDIKETLHFALSLPLDRIQAGVFIPYPGSEADGQTSQMDAKTIRAWQNRIHWRFYFRPRILLSILKNLKLSQIIALMKHPWLRGKA